MNLDMINDLLARCDGNFSTMYSIVKDRLETYTYEELPFRGEFLFFENYYYLIKQHMLTNNIDGDIIDIGCQYGFQSEIFLDNKSYTGIDIYQHKFFNTDKTNVRYYIGAFPSDYCDITNKIVVSVMSLGFFNKWIDEDEEKVSDMIATSLQKCNKLYIVTTGGLKQRLNKYFTKQQRLSKLGTFNSLYYLSK